MNIVVRLGIISASLARAGMSVGGASRCLSIPSNTRTNLRCPSLSFDSVHPSINLLNSTSNCARFSQRPTVWEGSIAFDTALTVCSKRWRPPIHSADLTIAYRSSSSSWACPLACPLLRFADSSARIDSVMMVFPVASSPYKTRFRHGAARI